MNGRTTLYCAVAGVLAIGVGLSCGTRPQPDVPVYASPVDLTQLAGEWRGEYSSRDGRAGQVVFDLEPGTSTARGEVYMYPEMTDWRGRLTGDEYGEPMRPTSAAPEPIPVEFVWTEGGFIQGKLAPYRDPVLDRTLQTGFRGDWRGELIEGRFASRDGGRVVREGWWRAVRVGGAVEGAPPRTGDRGPSYEELSALGREVFESRGCTECHAGPDARPEGADAGREAPGLEAVSRHRTFPWIYHMVVYPDSMLREDPAAGALMRGYDTEMRDLGVTPWEALLLYEYLVERAAETR
ncbi:MAG: hypothetical protein ACODAA_08035 [Gemmatimonadota bacterium]